MLSLLLLLGLGSGGPAGSAPQGFVPLPGRPSNRELECAYRGHTEWAVSITGGQLRVSEAARSEDPLPFVYDRGPDRSGARHVVRVDDGWLVGFDAGEFGGGLWWFSHGGERSVRLRPSVTFPAHSDDAFRTENVRGFAQQGDDLLVLMGLDHLSGRSGRIFRVRSDGGDRALELFAVLDSGPSAWIADRERVLVLTHSGLWEALGGGSTRDLHSVDFGSLYPTSLVEVSGGALYAGMQRFVLRLEPAGSGWTEKWFVKADCVRTRLTDFECQCIP